jgi:large subunit ribosomal protein L15
MISLPNPGSKKNRKRVGRGISAGQGKTAGRVQKGKAPVPVKAATYIARVVTCHSIDACHSCAARDLRRLNSVEYNEVNLDQLAESFKAMLK